MKCHPGSRSEEQEDAGKRLLIERKVLGNEKRFFEFSDTWHLTKRLSIKRSIPWEPESWIELVRA